MSIANLRVSHRPNGLEHPYRSEPDERSPRQPLAGEPVILGARVEPAGGAERVWASWSVNGGLAREAVGRPYQLEGEPPGRFWQVVLPPFKRGDQVAYSLHAAGPAGEVRTEAYTCQVAGWHSTSQVVERRRLAQGVALGLAPEGKRRPECWLLAAFPEPGRIHFRLVVRANLPDEEGQLPALPAKIDWLEETDERQVLDSGEVQLVVGLQPLHLEIRSPGGRLLLEGLPQVEWLSRDDGQILAVRQKFASPAEEGFYGFGERFNALNQRGQTLDVRVFEEFARLGLKNYIPIPFFISSLGYGLHLQTYRYVAYDLAVTDPGCWSYTAELGDDASLDYQVFVSPQPAQIVRAFSDQTGKPALPPAWVFGPWMSGNEWNSQERVMREVQLSQQHGIPASVLVIEAWSDETTFYIWNDAQYTPRPGSQSFAYSDFSFPPDGHWPDPKGLIDWLHSQGIKVLLWQIPVLKQVDYQHAQHNLDQAHMLQQGYMVRSEQGEPYRVRPFWFHDGLLLDFTNPEAEDWWLNKRAYLLDELGIDGFKTDGGEHLWSRGARFANGMRGDEGWNRYVNLYVEAYYRFTKEKRAGDGICFSRAGTTGAQAFPCHWAGDEYSSWEAYRGSLLAGLNAGLSGIPFWGWDLAGFSGEIPSAELYLRSAAMATFCPILQYHMDYNAHRQPSRDRTPWNIAERTGRPEVIDIYRKFTRLRMQLVDYIYQEAEYCARTGEPLMRPLFLDWPGDPQAWQVADQYSFGRTLLVAPVVEPETTSRHLYLPDGDWIDFWTGLQFSGPGWIERDAPLDEIPVYVRAGHAWPVAREAKVQTTNPV